MNTCLRTSISLTVLILLAVSPLLSQQQEKPDQQEQQQAELEPVVDPEVEAVQTILQTLEPQQRLARAEGFLATYPESQYRANILLAASEAYRMMENFDKAVEYAKRALELNPRDAISMLLIADSLSEGARPTQADYVKRLNESEDYIRRALAVLPELFAAARRPDVPEEQYKLREQYIEAQAHATLGYIHYRRKQFVAAEEELKLAVEMNQLRPNPADFERLGVVQVERGKYEEAKLAFQRCQELGGEDFQRTCQVRLERLQQKTNPEPAKPQE